MQSQVPFVGVDLEKSAVTVIISHYMIFPFPSFSEILFSFSKTTHFPQYVKSSIASGTFTMQCLKPTFALV